MISYRSQYVRKEHSFVMIVTIYADYVHFVRQVYEQDREQYFYNLYSLVHLEIIRMCFMKGRISSILNFYLPLEQELYHA